uniref:Lamina-associated polypeptide 2 n=1 Tax=Ascaris lumbricoides TaxID=6252 RepID=A0A0M3I393_ASCLU
MKNDEAATLYPVLAVPLEPKIPDVGKPEVPMKPSFLQKTSHPPLTSEGAGQCTSTNNEFQNTTVPSMPPQIPPKGQAVRRLLPMDPKTATTSVYTTKEESIANFSERQELIPPTQPNSALEKFHFFQLVLILILCLIMFGLLLALYLTM